MSGEFVRQCTLYAAWLQAGLFLGLGVGPPALLFAFSFAVGFTYLDHRPADAKTRDWARIKSLWGKRA